MTPEIWIRSPCSYSLIWPSPSDPTWHSVGKGSSQPSMQGSSYFSVQPQQSWVSEAGITHLLCRDWRGRNVSCQKVKYKSTGMNGMWDHKWTQFYRSPEGKIWVLLWFQRTSLKIGWSLLLGGGLGQIKPRRWVSPLENQPLGHGGSMGQTEEGRTWPSAVLNLLCTWPQIFLFELQGKI